MNCHFYPITQGSPNPDLAASLHGRVVEAPSIHPEAVLFLLSVDPTTAALLVLGEYGVQVLL